MFISSNNDFNNIFMVLEIKLFIYLLLLECIVLMMYISLNCLIENIFILNFFRVVGGGESVNGLLL